MRNLHTWEAPQSFFQGIFSSVHGCQPRLQVLAEFKRRFRDDCMYGTKNKMLTPRPLASRAVPIPLQPYESSSAMRHPSKLLSPIPPVKRLIYAHKVLLAVLKLSAYHIQEQHECSSIPSHGLSWSDPMGTLQSCRGGQPPGWSLHEKTSWPGLGFPSAQEKVL